MAKGAWGWNVRQKRRRGRRRYAFRPTRMGYKSGVRQVRTGWTNTPKRKRRRTRRRR